MEWITILYGGKEGEGEDLYSRVAEWKTEEWMLQEAFIDKKVTFGEKAIHPFIVCLPITCLSVLRGTLARELRKFSG